MNTDIRLSVDFYDHPKIVKLERRLGFEGVKALQLLWLWTAKNRPDGVLSGMDEEDIAIAARWTGDVTQFNSVLTELRLVDNLDGAYHVHDWKDHNSWQAEAIHRSDSSRFRRMAATHKDIHKALRDKGYSAITRDAYTEITNFNYSLTQLEQLLNCSSSPCLSFPLPFPFGFKRETSLRSVSSSEPAASDQQASPAPEVVQGEEEPKKPRKPKAKTEPLPVDSEAYRLAESMRDELRASLPTLKEPDLQKWANDFDIALRNDGRMKDPRFVAQVIRWVAKDDFWRSNCQCPASLRKQFDKLTARMEAEAAKARASPVGTPRANSTLERNMETAARVMRQRSMSNAERPGSQENYGADRPC